MLEYNPFFRPSAKECLQNPIFDEIRVTMLERDAQEEIVTEVDEILPIDYDTGRVRGLEKSPEITQQVIQYFKIEILKEIYELRSMYKKKWAKISFMSSKCYSSNRLLVWKQSVNFMLFCNFFNTFYRNILWYF